ncbi:hypothetical protein QR680_009398 [Steinernema hermaphroditum]|uniref:CDT1 Geminin-binding domain-containing protein n=1 Tax=Steinernema hermaphroditum TaxID=289476 RepID=A0AA39M9T3_9BILA|nr:hypothetical protein QR680_009398 [Steinernema hermaphroditum]
METRRTTRRSTRVASNSIVQPQIKDFFSARRCPTSRNLKSAKVATVTQPKTSALTKKKELKKAVVTGETVKNDEFMKEVTPEQGSVVPMCRPMEEELVLSPVKREHSPLVSPSRLNAKRALFQDGSASPSSSDISLEPLTKDSIRRHLEDSEPGSSSFTFTAPSPRKKPRTEDSVQDVLAGDTNKYGNLDKLTNNVRLSSRLPLPKKFERLYNHFKHMERIVQISLSMGKRIVFEDVKNDVEKHGKCAFTVDHFAQLLHIYPESYNVKLEKKRYTRAAPDQMTSHEYVVEPNLKNDVEGFLRIELPKHTGPVPMVSPTKLVSPLKSPRKSPQKAIPQQREAVLDHRPRLEGWRIQCRLYILKHKLISHVKECYKRHLQNMGMTVTLEQLAKVSRFDDFDLESVDDIPTAVLPQPPKAQNSYEEFMKKVTKEKPSGLLHGKNKDILKKDPSGEAGADIKPAETQPKKMSLLERIKAKEKAKKSADAEQAERTPLELRLSRLRDMVKRNGIYNLEQLFRVKNRTQLPTHDVISALARSCNASSGEMTQTLNLIVEISSNLLECVTVSNVKYLKWKTQSRNLEGLIAAVNTEIARISAILTE